MAKYRKNIHCIQLAWYTDLIDTYYPKICVCSVYNNCDSILTYCMRVKFLISYTTQHILIYFIVYNILFRIQLEKTPSN